MPRIPRNGSIENILNTRRGAQIIFRCNTGFIPAGDMMATCVSQDRVLPNGTWTPDPADLVCSGEILNEQTPQIL